MATEETVLKGEELEARAPGGFGITLRSPPGERGTSIQFLMALASMALMIFLASQINAKADEIKQAWLRSEETQQALIYMLSLPQAQREALNIAKPKVIRDMQRRDGS